MEVCRGCPAKRNSCRKEPKRGLLITSVAERGSPQTRGRDAFSKRIGECRARRSATAIRYSSQFANLLSCKCLRNMARPGRVELPTLCLEGRRSIQLSYGRLDLF